MHKSKVLYSALIKKSRLINNNTTRITIPQKAIQLANLESDFYEITAYQNRIEIRSHSFKFINKRKNPDIEKETMSKETIPEPSEKPKSILQSGSVHTATFDATYNNSDELDQIFDRICSESEQ